MRERGAKGRKALRCRSHTGVTSLGAPLSGGPSVRSQRGIPTPQERKIHQGLSERPFILRIHFLLGSTESTELYVINS